jgi:hypothetical protein
LGPIAKTGALSITSVHPNANNTILPQDGSLNIASYTIQGTGPYGLYIGEATNSSGNFSVIRIIPGDWTISIVGMDSNQKVLVHGSTVVTVQVGKTIGTTIELKPTEGIGSLELSVYWSESLLVDTVEGTLTPSGGIAEKITFTVNALDATATYSNPAIPAGSYSLVVESSHEGTVSAPAQTLTVYVYDGLTSSGTINLESIIQKFKVLNSWGIGGWENVDDGYIWMTAEVMKKVGVFIMFQENLVNYDPRYLLTFSLDHERRADIKNIFVDLYESTQAYSEGFIRRKHFTPYNLQYTKQGGAEAFPIDTVSMDITEWSAELNPSRKIVLWIKESADSVLGTVQNLALEVYDGYKNTPQKIIVSNDTPTGTIKDGWVAVMIDLSDLPNTAKSPRSLQPPSLVEELFYARGITDHEFNELKESIGVRDPEVNL